MADVLVLGDFKSSTFRFRVGQIVDDASIPLAALQSQGLSTIAYDVGMQPTINGWLSQRRINNRNTTSLAMALLAKGLFPVV